MLVIGTRYLNLRNLLQLNQPHNLKVAGSNPAPPTTITQLKQCITRPGLEQLLSLIAYQLHGPYNQLHDRQVFNCTLFPSTGHYDTVLIGTKCSD